ncbi:hypothetical protein [Halobacillus sp. Marseille-P3879]|uniref:hypothetical protein n=1 Tax=Halobacillus sp. Marseille-P3879 TaxID=2045014 RepID=UPI000C7DABA3|nr:hypothetical protein [Halobacillus sp. Marseille-P3879]
MDLFIYAVLILMLLLFVGRGTSMEKRVKRLEETLRRVTEQVDLPPSSTDEELKQLVREGKDVQAVKRARKELGLSLIEAKEYIDKL